MPEHELSRLRLGMWCATVRKETSSKAEKNRLQNPCKVSNSLLQWSIYIYIYTLNINKSV